MRKQTDDEILARGDLWRGDIAELRGRMSHFTVDGARFGTLLPRSRSGSGSDDRLDKRSEEIWTAAFVLGRLGYKSLKLVTKTSEGAPLDRPDLQATLDDGATVGIEVAQVGPTSRMKRDSLLATLEYKIRDLIADDASFASAFGEFYLSVRPFGAFNEREVTKRQAEQILGELVQFIVAREHTRIEPGEDNASGMFSREYPTLHKENADYYSAPFPLGQYFAARDGGTLNPKPETAEVIRVLDEHRRKARGYRTKKTWILMYLPDSTEVFRRTASAIELLKPEITPFEQCHILDACGSLTTLP